MCLIYVLTSKNVGLIGVVLRWELAIEEHHTSERNFLMKRSLPSHNLISLFSYSSWAPI